VRWVTGSLLAAAVGQAVLDAGGFGPGSRVVFLVLAIGALCGAFAVDRRAARKAVLSPAVVVLLALGALGALSALWTVGFAWDSVRWGMVTVGYGAVAASAGVLARGAWGVWLIAGGICVLAAVSAIFGLAGVVTFTGPFADYTGGTWRPGGTLEYSAAMSLLAVSALPGVLSGMCATRRWLQAGAVLCGVLCAAVLALAASRLELAMAAVVCIAVVGRPLVTVRAPREVGVAAIALLVVAGVGAHLIAGGRVGAAASPHAALRGGELVALFALCCLVWLGVRGRVGHVGRQVASISRRPVLAIVAVACAVLLAGVATAWATEAGPGQGHPAVDGGFWHGRLRTWQAAIDTFADRPVAGSGADSFLAASVLHQRFFPVRFAHDLPLELAAELGVAGFVLAVALYGSSALALWRSRRRSRFWLLGPAVIGFLVANLLDWPWHLAGSGAVWAAALGACCLSTTLPPPRNRDDSIY
jgi:hypothetical protein